MDSKKNKKKEKFIQKAKIKHGDKYDYSLVNYVNSTTKVKIKCLKHNIIFLQTPAEHLRGKKSCNLCKKNPKYDTSFFIKKAKEIHGDEYDYSLVNYVNSTTKVKIKCSKHGEFKQLPHNHLKGQGCPKCGKISASNKKRYSTDKFIEKAKNIHNDKYNYSKVKYVNSNTKIKIICPIHGKFMQTPSKHLSGQGCNQCGIDRTKNKLIGNKSQFIEKAKKVHGDEYDYSKVSYTNSHTKVRILCLKHGEFEQLPYDHISGHGCEKCSSSISKSEIEINDFLNKNGIKTITSSTSIINPYQLDIFIPSNKVAIEFNGLYWHNELYLDKDYHLNKTEICENNGINLIHIFEDEWIFKKDIVKSRLKNIMGLSENKIYARKTNIREVKVKEARKFCDKNHLQGYTNSSIKLGLYYNDELVSIMLFTKPRLGIGSKYNGYELSRFCNKLNTSVIGGASKLLKHFIKKYSPEEIRSYADRRWSKGGLYEKLGFKKVRINRPNYWYIIGKKRKHRFNFRKSKLVKEGYDKSKSAHEIMKDRGIYRIYDCGTITYVKKYNYFK